MPGGPSAAAVADDAARYAAGALAVANPGGAITARSGPGSCQRRRLGFYWARTIKIIGADMKIGFVGLGNMGNAIAVNLLKAGHQLFINDLARELQSNLEIQGARWRDDLVKLGSEAEVVFTALPGAAEVTAVMLGDQGVLAGMKAGTCYIDLGTNDDATLAKLAAAGDARGVQVLHAAMAGGVANARDGSMTLDVRGDAAAFDACAPLLRQIAREVAHRGPLPAG